MVTATWYLIPGDCYLVRVGVIATALFSRGGERLVMENSAKFP